MRRGFYGTEMIQAINPSIMGPEATYASEDAANYMEWFKKHSHVWVSDPIHDGICAPPQSYIHGTVLHQSLFLERIQPA
ncbi:hypothetical protein LIER_24641 [Lithospermum erythrorhizon]|uniref:Uncharacterized protein n=1 Tax=Lithospermum erythrorhizon TaxID=34254 RepID=A0AAV3R1S7_LITER